MNEQRRVPAEEIRRRLEVKNSLFITSLRPVFSLEEARSFIKNIEAEFPDASHHVPAYLVGTGASIIAHCSDNGEPSGTAGRPALAVLQGSDLGNVAVVITRYFGGTKLGTGGLVKAYTEAVKSVVDVVPRAEIVEGNIFMLEIPYSSFDRIQYSLEQNGVEIQEREFGAQVDVTVFVVDEKNDWFKEEIANLSSGGIEPVLVERKSYLKRV